MTPFVVLAVIVAGMLTGAAIALCGIFVGRFIALGTAHMGDEDGAGR